VNSCEYTEMT